MKPFILLIAVLLALGLLVGCSPLTPEIPLQNDTPEIAVESPSGAVVAENAEEAAGEVTEDNASEEEAAVSEEEIAVEEVAEETAPEVERVPESTYVTLSGVGFEVKEVRIKVGETVAWKNEREGRQTKAIVLGTQWCSSIVRSKMFGPGEVYRATFNKAGTCTVVDGMYTTELMKVIVEE